MISTLCDIVTSITEFFTTLSTQLTLDMLFIIALGVEAVLVVFFLIKSAFSYEASLNRALDKLNFWLFNKKNVTEDNIKDLNMLFKTKAPKRLCYYWQQYILFREGNPSSYLSTENLVEKPLKTSSYNSNIKNLTLISTIWSLIVAMFVLLETSGIGDSYLTGKATAKAILLPIFIGIIAAVFVVYLRARKNAILNSLYQNVALFGRFMDNACVDLPTYIDYQILFTPQEIEKGQPVLREFLDYKARKEKEEFNKAKEENIDYETYDFSATGVDSSIVLERAMKESELYLKKKDRILVKISQLEAELDSRKKNFDNVQKESQTKLQASKENIKRLRQMQEETTNRIESNYYRKQQTQEVAKQEQLEQEFEQQRAKYLLEKNEGEEEIKKLNDELEGYKQDVESAMLGEYQTFFDKFCHSAEKVVAKVFNDKINNLKAENEKDKEYITQLEIKLKNIPQGAYDAESGQNLGTANVAVTTSSEEIPAEGKYDENGNYIYPNGTYYDTEGNFHDEKGNVYSQDGQLISSAPTQTQVEEIPAEGKYDENGNYIYPNGTYYDTEGNFHDENGNVYSQDGQLISSALAQETKEEPKQEKTIVDFDDFDTFDFMTDTAQKGDVYNVAENIVNDVDKDDDIEIVNNSKKSNFAGVEEDEEKPAPKAETTLQDFSLTEEKEETPVVETKPVVEEPAKTDQKKEPKEVEQVEAQLAPKKKAGRPKKIVKAEEEKPAGKRGRPRKIVDQKTPATKKVGRPKKEATATAKPVKNKVGRPKKIVKDNAVAEPAKRGRGRPKKNDSIEEINKRLLEEEAKISKMRKNLNKELQNAMSEMNTKNIDSKQTRREELIKEIDTLQKEAKDAINKKENNDNIAEINAKLENLLEEIKKLNS